jgi:nitrogen fixation/metabolism regulation signal transduction histidine kinase
VDITQQIHSVLALYAIAAQDQKVIIATTMEQLSHPVDAELFGMMMENLVKNALEAQPRGGYINIVLQRYPDYLLLQIENGSSADIDLEQCPAPYYTTKTRGTGLGLAMVKKIILAHGGELTLEQPDNNCFLVQISLPVKVAP